MGSGAFCATAPSSPNRLGRNESDSLSFRESSIQDFLYSAQNFYAQQELLLAENELKSPIQPIQETLKPRDSDESDSEDGKENDDGSVDNDNVEHSHSDDEVVSVPIGPTANGEALESSLNFPQDQDPEEVSDDDEEDNALQHKPSSPALYSRSAPPQDQSDSSLLLEAIEPAHLDPDPLNCEVALQYLHRIARHCSFETFESFVPTVLDLDLDESFQATFKRRKFDDLPWRDPAKLHDPRWPSTENAFLDNVETEVSTKYNMQNFQMYVSLPVTMLQEDLDVHFRSPTGLTRKEYNEWKSKKVKREEMYDKLRQHAQFEERRALGNINNVRHSLIFVLLHCHYVFVTHCSFFYDR